MICFRKPAVISIKRFEVDVDVNWSDRKVSVYTEYIVRILDNISSNIVKYADSVTR